MLNLLFTYISIYVLEGLTYGIQLYVYTFYDWFKTLKRLEFNWVFFVNQSIYYVDLPMLSHFPKFLGKQIFFGWRVCQRVALAELLSREAQQKCLQSSWGAPLEPTLLVLIPQKCGWRLLLF